MIKLFYSTMLLAVTSNAFAQENDSMSAQASTDKDDDTSCFTLQGINIHRTCGHQMFFEDETKGIQFDIPLRNCTFAN